MTKEELSKYKEYKISLKSVEEKIEYLREKKSSIKSQIINDMPTSSGDCIDKLMVILEEMEDTIKLYLDEQDKILKSMKNIEDNIVVLNELEKTVIRYVYFDNKSFNEVSKKINYSYSTVRRIHKSAIDNLQGEWL